MSLPSPSLPDRSSAEEQARPPAAAEAARLAFPETSDPARYVPRAASETALRELERAVLGGVPVSALLGPPGIGKTLLLRLLGRRIAHRGVVVQLPYGALDADDLCDWAIRRMDRELGADTPAPPPESDVSPRTRLAARARHLHEPGEGGLGVVVCIDDANSIPLGTMRDLTALAGEGSGLQWVLAAVGDSATHRLLAACPSEPARVLLREPLSPAEVRDYVGRCVARIPPAERELRARFDARALDWIERLSGGNPRRIHDLGSWILDAPDEAVRGGWCDSDWGFQAPGQDDLEREEPVGDGDAGDGAVAGPGARAAVAAAPSLPRLADYEAPSARPEVKRGDESAEAAKPAASSPAPARAPAKHEPSPPSPSATDPSQPPTAAAPVSAASPSDEPRTGPESSEAPADPEPPRGPDAPAEPAPPRLRSSDRAAARSRRRRRR